jgi:hypothetical protein
VRAGAGRCGRNLRAFFVERRAQQGARAAALECFEDDDDDPDDQVDQTDEGAIPTARPSNSARDPNKQPE